MPEIVNVVGAGSLGREIDVQAVADDIEGVVKTSGDDYRTPVVYIKETDDSPLVTLFESGSFHISGADSVDELDSSKEWFLNALEALGIDFPEVSFSIRNIVVVGDLEQSLNLNAIAIQFGLENTEYEPEQFPGLVYRPDEYASVFLIFGSGKVVIPGSTDVDSAFEAFEWLSKQIEAMTIGL